MSEADLWVVGGCVVFVIVIGTIAHAATSDEFAALTPLLRRRVVRMAEARQLRRLTFVRAKRREQARYGEGDSEGGEKPVFVVTGVNVFGNSERFFFRVSGRALEVLEQHEWNDYG